MGSETIEEGSSVPCAAYAVSASDPPARTNKRRRFRADISCSRFTTHTVRALRSDDGVICGLAAARNLLDARPEGAALAAGSAGE
jgi:hypothetical protein